MEVLNGMFHFIGICPDSISHFDLIDLVVSFDQVQIIEIIKKVLS